MKINQIHIVRAAETGFNFQNISVRKLQKNIHSLVSRSLMHFIKQEKIFNEYLLFPYMTRNKIQNYIQNEFA